MIKLIYNTQCPACVETKPVFDALAQEFSNRIPMDKEELSAEVIERYKKFLPEEVKINELGVEERTTPFPIPLVLFLQDDNYIGHLVGINEHQIRFLLKEVYGQQ